MAKKEQVAFLLQKDQKEIIDELDNEEAGIIFKAIYEYECTKKEPKLNKTLKIVFKQFKVKLDNYDNAYEEKCLKNKENIDKYWEKIRTNTNEYERIQSNTMATNKRKINKNKINKIKENENKLNKINNNINNINNSERESNNNVATATTPTLDDILSYGSELNVDKKYCKKFFNTYSAIDWKTTSGTKITNWKAKFEQWVEEDNIADKQEEKRYL